ncbi:hypothetical protein pb186bvf_013657 [Paramecium bursaria]
MKKPQVQTVIPKIQFPNAPPLWQYSYYSQQLNVLEQYLHHNQKDIYQQQTSGAGFMDHIKQLLTQIGGYIHPQLQDGQMLRFSNYKVDVITLKLIQTFIQASNLQVIDFRFNQLTNAELEIIYGIIQHKILKLFIDFNPNVDINKIAPFYNIQYLYLRGNNITNEQLVPFFNNLHQQLKLLELGNNRISGPGCDALAEYLNKPNILEAVGLSQNNIRSFVEIKNLCFSFGKTKLSNEDFAKIQDLEQQREAQIQKLTKAKKKYTDDMLIKVPTYQKIDNFYYQIQNPQFNYLNLSQNELPELDRDNLDKFMTRLLDDFVIVLTHNQFEQSTKAKLRKKYKKNLII